MCCGLCARFPCSCGILAAFLGTFCIFCGSCAASIYVKLTPLYTTISCQQAKLPELRNFHLGLPLVSPTTFDIIVQMNCTNPNPYSIGFDWIEMGGVFLGKSMTKVGDTSGVPGKTSFFPADGFGSIWVRANTTVNALLITELLGDVLTSGGELPLKLQLRQRLHVDVSLMAGIGKSVSQLFEKEGGMMIANLGLRPNIGPMACADSFDQLAIPPVGADVFDGTMRFSAKQVAPKKIQEGMDLKNWSLGISMAVFFTLGLVLYIMAGCQFWSVFRGSDPKGKHLEMGSSSESSCESGAEGNAC